MTYQLVISQQIKWNIPYLIGCIIIIVLYYLFVGKRERKQFFFFSLGMVLLYLLLGSPLRTFSHLTFTSHMLQISILYFIAPQFIILGMNAKLLQKIGNFLVKDIKINPYLFIIFFSFFLYMYHLPAVFTFITSQKIYHDLSIWILFFLASLMWIPYFSFKKIHNSSFATVYKTINIWLITPACILLIIVPVQDTNPLLNQMINLCIPPGVHFELLKPIIDSKLDQQLAGTVMFFIHKASFLIAGRLTNLGMSRKESECTLDFFFKREF